MLSSLRNDTGGQLEDSAERLTVAELPLPVEPWKPWSSPLTWARLAIILLVLIAIDALVFAPIWWLVAVILRHI